MIRSMTGYGAGESDQAGMRTSVEVRSVNGRFCDISVKTPRALASLEGRVREHVQAQVKRGNVSVSIRRDGDTAEATSLSVDFESGQRYCEALKQLQNALDLPGEITISMIAAYPSLLKTESEAIDVEQGWVMVEPALAEAIKALNTMKEREGRQLEQDMRGRVDQIQAGLDKIEVLAPLRVAAVKQRLHDRLAEWLVEDQIDPQRLAMEVTLYADRSDITEECVRLRTHCEAFTEALNADDSAGRRLNFLLQEMNREINTIGSKSNDAEISHQVITLKEELEKIREQVQNIE
jgi:uncharacterized protein (TIGR00255 family)